MARKALTKAAKEAAKRANQYMGGRPAGSPNKLSKALDKKTKAKTAPKPKAKASPPKAKAKPATTKKRSARATKTKLSPATQKRNTAASKAPTKTKLSPATQKRNARASKIPTAAQAAIAAPAVGLTALAITSKKKPETEGTFGEAFKAARKQGEGTKFTYKGKQYSAVTKDDLKRKGYDANELRQYMNRKGKARGPLNRLGQGVKKVLLGKDKKFGGDKGAIDFIRGRKKPVKKSGKPGSRKMAKFKAGGAVMANRGLGKAYMKSKR